MTKPLYVFFRASLWSFLALSTLLPQSTLAGGLPSSDRSCVRQLAVPVVEKLAGCDAAFCVALDQGRRLCACQRLDDDAATLSVRASEAFGTSVEWKAEISPVMFAPDALRVDAIRGGRAGGAEYVVALRKTVSMGMGIEDWEVRLLAPGRVSPTIAVDDYGSMSQLACAKKGSEIRLLRTQWRSGWEAERGYGLYAVGRWYRLVGPSEQDPAWNEAFSPDLDRPMIQHRFTFGLEKARRRALADTAAPQRVEWFGRPEAQPIEGAFPFE